jgi:hypothetical protein
MNFACSAFARATDALAVWSATIGAEIVSIATCGIFSSMCNALSSVSVAFLTPTLVKLKSAPAVASPTVGARLYQNSTTLALIFPASSPLTVTLGMIAVFRCDCLDDYTCSKCVP